MCFADGVQEAIDVAEVYSAPRVAAAAKKMGLREGWALDICTIDEMGSRRISPKSKWGIVE